MAKSSHSVGWITTPGWAGDTWKLRQSKGSPLKTGAGSQPSQRLPPQLTKKKAFLGGGRAAVAAPAGGQVRLERSSSPQTLPRTPAQPSGPQPSALGALLELSCCVVEGYKSFPALGNPADKGHVAVGGEMTSFVRLALGGACVCCGGFAWGFGLAFLSPPLRPVTRRGAGFPAGVQAPGPRTHPLHSRGSAEKAPSPAAPPFAPGAVRKHHPPHSRLNPFPSTLGRNYFCPRTASGV